MLTKSKTKKGRKDTCYKLSSSIGDHTNKTGGFWRARSLSQSDIQDKVGFAMYTIFDPNNTVKDVADTHDTHTLLQYY